MFLKNVVYHGDCVKVMSEFPEKSVDLVVTSPPYDSLRTYNGSLDWSFDVFKRVADGLVRVLKDGGVIVWVVNDATIDGSESGTSFKQALHFKELGLRIFDTMIWEKDGIGSPHTNRYHSCFEYMFIFSKGRPKTFNPLFDYPNKTAGRVTGKHTVRESDESTSARVSNTPILALGKRRNVWHQAAEKNRTIKHPAVFPLTLAKDHITTWSNPGDTVLDPFAGSGTTLLACKQLNRDYVGIEKESIYKSMIDERLGLSSLATRV